jgi:DNA-binding transcriptional ArsR family regulator
LSPAARSSLTSTRRASRGARARSKARQAPREERRTLDDSRTDESDLDAVFHALAHPVRRRLLDLVREHPGSNVNDVCRPFALSRIAVMKHLRALEAARLLVSRKSGRSRELYFNAVPIQQIYDRWTDEYSALWAKRLLDLKRRVESVAGVSEESGEASATDASGGKPA